MIDQKMPTAFLVAYLQNGHKMVRKTTSYEEVYKFKVACESAGITYQVNMDARNIDKVVYRFKPNWRKVTSFTRRLHKETLAQLKLDNTKNKLKKAGFILD